jgi:hypothetical protein
VAVIEKTGRKGNRSKKDKKTLFGDLLLYVMEALLA